MVASTVVIKNEGKLGHFRLKKSFAPVKLEPLPPPLSKTRTEESLLFKILHSDVAPCAAAIGYLDDKLLEQNPLLSREEVKQNYMEDLPLISNLLKTQLGTIATVIIPRFQSEIFDDENALLSDLVNAFKLCKAIGVEFVSLTGLIPSATNYGLDLQRVLQLQSVTLPSPSTGHSTTTACMILTIQRVLQEAGRLLSDEKVAFLGMGSIGLATLRLMLRVLPHPKQITICDLFSKKEKLAAIVCECQTIFGFKGVIEGVSSASEAPAEVYEHTFIIGATNVANVLDVEKLKPGTCVVDDSAPHCFDAAKAIQRCLDNSDILVTEGGPVRLTTTIMDTFYLPKRWESPTSFQENSKLAPDSIDRVFDIGTKKDPREIMGCTLSPLLTFLNPALKPTLGEIDLEMCIQHYNTLSKLGFEGCSLSCDDFVFDPKFAAKFRKQTCSRLTGRTYVVRDY